MNRPGPVGITILLAFALVAAIEFRTLLGMLGVEVQTQLYFITAAVVIGATILALLSLPDADTESTQHKA